MHYEIKFYDKNNYPEDLEEWGFLGNDEYIFSITDIELDLGYDFEDADYIVYHYDEYTDSYSPSHLIVFSEGTCNSANDMKKDIPSIIDNLTFADGTYVVRVNRDRY